jgi:hypothetical protein
MTFRLRRFLRCPGVDRLERHFRARHPDVAASVDWGAGDDELRAALEAAILARPAGRDELFSALERVHLLADVPGDRAMVAACGRDEAAIEEMRVLGNAHERALWLLGRGDGRFGRAEEIRFSDHHAGAGRQWTGFVGPRERWPDLAAERLERFKARVETAFRTFDGSGSSIAVHPFERPSTSRERHGDGPVFQVSIYLEGLPQTSTEFAHGELVHRGVRPALEMALTYAPETGAIDVVAHAGKERRTDVARAFAEELFPADARLEPVRLRQFDLSRLARAPSLPTAPEDGIRAVRLVLARFVVDGRFARVTLETEKGSPHTLHEMSRSVFGPYDPFERARINRVRLVIQFEPRGDGCRGRSLPVELTEPHGCNLRDRSDHERLIGEKYLRLWGLVRDA